MFTHSKQFSIFSSKGLGNTLMSTDNTLDLRECQLITIFHRLICILRILKYLVWVEFLSNLVEMR